MKISALTNISVELLTEESYPTVRPPHSILIVICLSDHIKNIKQ